LPIVNLLLITKYQVDIWSFGITIFELANQNPPLHQVPPTKAIGLIPKRPPPRLEGEGNWSSQLRWFVALCLNEKPEDRPTVEELQKSKFIKTAKAPVSIIRDLIHRHREWEARGNVRNSLLYGNRDSIAIPNPLSVPDWDFNTVQSRASGVPKEWGILSSETIKAHSSSRGTGTAERLGGAEQLYRLFDDPNQDQPPLLDNYSQSTSSGNSNEGLKVISIPSFDENGMLIASPPPMISIPCEEEINRMAQQKAPVTARFMPISSAAAYPAPLPPATQTVLPFDRATAMKTRSNRAGSASTSGSRTFDTSSSAPPQTVKRDSSPLRPTVAASAPSSPPRMVLSQTGPTVSQAPATNGGFKSHHLASKSVPTFSGRREDPSLPPVPAMGSSQPAVADATGPHMKSRSQDTTFRQPHLQHQQARRPSHLNLSPPNTSNFNFGDGGSRLPPSPSRPYHTGANIGTNVGNPSTPSSTTNSFGSSYTTSGSRPVYYTIYDVPPIPPVDLSILFPPNPYMMENELNRVIDALADSLEKIFCSLENFAENAQHPRESGEEEE
jgi:protein-serine/threonine kinase